MYTLNQFNQSKWSLVVYQDHKRIFNSKASGIEPLIKYIYQYKTSKRKLIIFDKYIGKAAGLLLALIKPDEVHTRIISQGGLAVLNKFKIRNTYLKKVKYLMGIASDDMCRWEKLAMNKTPRQFWGLVKNLKSS